MRCYPMRSRSAHAVLVAGLFVVWTGTVGCDSQNNPILALLGGDGLPVVAATIDTQELGDEWTSALAVPLPSDGAIQVNGTIDGTDDVDVFDLGPVQAGDRIILQTEQGGGLDAAAGLFDDAGMLLIVNDDRSYSMRLYDPYIDHVVREDLPRCYLAVASSPYQPSTGSYSLTIERQPDVSVPQPEGQAVLLDFNGEAGVRIGYRQPVNVPAFDAADISSRYTGQTDEMIDLIEAMVMEDYADYDVDFYNTADGDNPTGDVTRVFFGSYDAGLLGLADTIDPYNTRPEEECIVFIETFELFMPLNPTLEEMATALANVAAHELGHLLGLNHTRDVTEVMDISASARQMLLDETFHVAPLDDGVFPIGLQDPGMLLMQALGAR